MTALALAALALSVLATFLEPLLRLLCHLRLGANGSFQHIFSVVARNRFLFDLPSLSFNNAHHAASASAVMPKNRP